MSTYARRARVYDRRHVYDVVLDVVLDVLRLSDVVAMAKDRSIV